MQRLPHDATSDLAVDQPTGRAPRTIFDLLTAYHASLDNMRNWLREAELSELERVAIADAWQSEMREWFRSNGHCFACNRALERCGCA
jgi:hypothetical protein